MIREPNTGALVHEQVQSAPDRNKLFFDCYQAAPQMMQDHYVALLVGRIYRDAPATLRQRMVEHLLRPLGLLSLTVVANGVFSRLRPHMDAEPGGAAALQAIQGSDVVTLVDFVQQVSVDCVENLGTLFASQAGLRALASVAVFLIVLKMRRAARPPRLAGQADDR